MRVCTARDACCNKKGHFCRSNSSAGTTAAIYEDPSAIVAIHGLPAYNYTTGITAAFPQSLSHAVVPLFIHGHTLTALTDSHRSYSFMNENIAKLLKLKIKPSTRNISMDPQYYEHKNTRILSDVVVVRLRSWFVSVYAFRLEIADFPDGVHWFAP